MIRTTKKVDVLSKELAIQSKSLDAILKLAEAKQDFLASIPAIQPVQNEKLRHVASGFGYRTDPFTKARKMHEGMDFPRACYIHTYNIYSQKGERRPAYP